MIHFMGVILIIMHADCTRERAPPPPRKKGRLGDKTIGPRGPGEGQKRRSGY